MEQITETKPVQPYYKQLDALRFFSVAAVTVGHWLAWNSNNYFVKKMHWGHGVLFFFVISGFLITEILLAQKDKIESGQRTFGRSLKTFYIRRTLRIFPVYYLLIIFLFAINYKNTRDIFPYLATYTLNIYESVTGSLVGNFNHFWSLAVEEQFYIIWPLVMFLVPKKYLLNFIIATIVISLTSHLCYTVFMPDNWMPAAYLTHNVMFALALGALLAYVKKHNTRAFAKLSGSVMATPLLLSVYLILFFTVIDKNNAPWLNFLLDDFIFTLLALVVVAKCVGEGYTSFIKVIFENKIIRHFGQLAYGLYLFHLFTSTVFYENATQAMMPVNKKLVWLLLFAITLAAAELSYWLIERPVTNLKKNFNY